MAKILAIKHVNVPQKDGQVKPSILVTTATADIWVTPGQWKSSGAGSTLGNYVGGNIDALYFGKGELLFDKITVCTDDNKILKQVYVSENPVVLANALAIESSNKMAEVSDMAMLYARNRATAVETAKKIEAKKLADALVAGAGVTTEERALA